MTRKYEEWAASLTVVGDEAYVPGEHVPRSYRRLTDEERATYDRDWMRRKRATKRSDQIASGSVVRAVASLHSLSCTGPTKTTGCRGSRGGCRKVVIYERVERAEMDRPATRAV